jgi:hypothetical protein
MTAANALRVKVGVTCALIFALALWSTTGPADSAPAPTAAPSFPDDQPFAGEVNPDGWPGPLPQFGPLRVVSVAEFPMSPGGP